MPPGAQAQPDKVWNLGGLRLIDPWVTQWHQTLTVVIQQHANNVSLFAKKMDWVTFGQHLRVTLCNLRFIYIGRDWPLDLFVAGCLPWPFMLRLRAVKGSQSTSIFGRWLKGGVESEVQLVILVHRYCQPYWPSWEVLGSFLWGPIWGLLVYSCYTRCYTHCGFGALRISRLVAASKHDTSLSSL